MSKNEHYVENFIRVQVYILHLLDGKTVEVREKYDLPPENGVIHKFAHANENEMFVVNNDFSSIYFPRRSVVAISTGNVEKIDKDTWEMTNAIKTMD